MGNLEMFELNVNSKIQFIYFLRSYYSDYSDISQNYYDLPLAYFLTGVAVYIYSFWATLRKYVAYAKLLGNSFYWCIVNYFRMAENSRMSKLSSKDDEYIFSWKLFTGWDFMIGNTTIRRTKMNKK